MGHGVGDCGVGEVFGGGTDGDALAVFVRADLAVQVDDVVADLVGDADVLEVPGDRGELCFVRAREYGGDLRRAAHEPARFEAVGGADLLQEGTRVATLDGFIEGGVVSGEVEGLSGVAGAQGPQVELVDAQHGGGL